MVFVSFLGFGQANVPKEFNDLLKKYYDKDFPTISTEEAQKKLNTKNVYFLDIREEEEFEVSHLPGAINYGSNSDNKSILKKIPKDAEVIVYCSIGYRSQKAGKELIKLGYTHVENLYGGIFQWFNEEKKVVNENNQATRKIHTYNEKWSKWVLKGDKVY